MKDFIKIVLIVLLFSSSFHACSCGGSGTTITGNTENPPVATVTVGKVSEDGETTVTMSYTVFGDSESDVDDASIDVYVNDSLYVNDLEPSIYYSSSTQTVSFEITGLSKGDVVQFVITLGDGSVISYIGTASESQDVTASTTTDIPEEEESGTGYDISNFYGIWIRDGVWDLGDWAEDADIDSVNTLIIGGTNCSNEIQFGTIDEVDSALEDADFSVSGSSLTITNDVLGTISITDIEFSGTFGLPYYYQFTGTLNGEEETFLYLTEVYSTGCDITEP